MAPCSYVNEETTCDLQSLLLVRRKGSAKDNDAKTSKGSAVPSGTSSRPAEKKKRQAPENDVQQATAQPMSSTIVASAVETKRTRGAQPTTTCTSNSNPGFSSNYKVAIGKGIRHQLNGFLKGSNSGNSLGTAVTSSTATANSMMPTSSSETVNNYTMTSSAYASAQNALPSASPPAEPMRFFDPSELGMGVESDSLSQLKSNFAAANSATTTSSADRESPSNSSDGGLDSLVNLAMVPVLDDSHNSNVNTNDSPSETPSTNNAYVGRSMLRRDDSLINLAASLPRSSPSEDQQQSDSFNFIDFPNHLS